MTQVPAPHPPHHHPSNDDGHLVVVALPLPNLILAFKERTHILHERSSFYRIIKEGLRYQTSNQTKSFVELQWHTCTTYTINQTKKEPFPSCRPRVHLDYPVILSRVNPLTTVGVRLGASQGSKCRALLKLRLLMQVLGACMDHVAWGSIKPSRLCPWWTITNHVHGFIELSRDQTVVDEDCDGICFASLPGITQMVKARLVSSPKDLSLPSAMMELKKPSPCCPLSLAIDCGPNMSI